MKRTLLPLLLFLSFIGQAQDRVYSYVEQMPEYPGSVDKFFADNLKYTKGAVENNERGRVAVKLTINSDGTVSDAKVVRGLGYGMDAMLYEAAMRMPKWKPGKNNGVPVDVYQTVSFPVSYHPGMIIDSVYEVKQAKFLAERQQAYDKLQADLKESKRLEDSAIAKVNSDREAAFRNDCIKKFGRVAGTKVADGKVELGMTKQMCEYAWGSPTTTNKTATKEGTDETWIYEVDKWLKFKNDKLVSVTQ